MTSLQHIAFAAALTIAACSPPATQAPAAPEAAAQTPAPGAKPSAATSAVAPAGAAPTAAVLVGRWGDNGDCAKDIVFNADGTFASYTGGVGNWSLDGEVMTMRGAGGTFQVRVEVIDANRLMIQNPDGSIGVSQRC